MCSASDAQIVKNLKTVGGSLGIFGWALLCCSIDVHLGNLCNALQSVGCSHYEFLLHPPDWVQRRGTNGNFSAIQTHNRPCSMGALACTPLTLSSTDITD